MSEAPGHHKVLFACGQHVESQCRCMSHEKVVIRGTTPCPTCSCVSAEDLCSTSGYTPNCPVCGHFATRHAMLADRVEKVLAEIRRRRALGMLLYPEQVERMFNGLF